MKASDYAYIRAFGEISYRLPIEILADQNLAAARGASPAVIAIDDRGIWQTVYDIYPPIMQQLVVQRAKEIHERLAEAA